MKHGILSLSCCLWLALAAVRAPGQPTAPAPAVAPWLKVGFAERDITPAIGMEQPGGYGKSFHTKIHDPCKVRAVVFDDGRQRVALVGIDALMILRDDVLAVRKAVQEACGIPADAILIGASHSHSSGPTGMIKPGDFDDAPDLLKELAYVKSSNADLNYLQMMRRQLVDAIVAADKDRKPLRCGIGSGHEDKAAYNRRFRMKNGQTWTHPRYGHPDILGPAGPIDPQVGVIGAFDDAGRLVGCVVNYACHATTSPGGASANWIHWLEKTIRGYYGPQVVVVFLQGASGDITQVNNLDPFQRFTPERFAEFVGGRVGAEALKVLFGMERGPMGPVDRRLAVFEVGRRIPSPQTVAAAMELLAQKPQGAQMLADWTFAKETVLLDWECRRRPKVECEVQAIQVGPAVFISNEAEYFVEFGLDIKKRSKFPYTFPVELANGCVGYVPTLEALSPTGGGYETRLTLYSNLEVNAGQIFADKGVELANQMSPGAEPLPPRLKPTVAPWTYGNVPPQLK